MSAEVDPADVAYVPTTGVGAVHVTPIVRATDESLGPLGCIVDDPEAFAVEIVRWPAQGWRPIDENSGDQGGVTEGVFEFWWRSGTLFARNNAVGDSYLFGWSDFPEQAEATSSAGREQALIWRANYHPDGGQLFYPIDGAAFVVPLASPGDDVRPEHFTTYYCAGTTGLYVRPNVWHGAVVPIADTARLLDRQGRVHARVSVDFPKEFGCYLAAPLVPPAE